MKLGLLTAGALALVLLVGCGAGAQNCNPQETPQSNPADFTACPGVTTVDGGTLYCRKAIDDPGAGGEECPIQGHECIEIFPTAPNPMGARRHHDVADGGPAAQPRPMPVIGGDAGAPGNGFR